MFKKKALKLATDMPLLLGEELSQPKMLSECDFPFMRDRPKFSKKAIWERVQKGDFTDLSVCSGIINLMRTAIVIPAWCDYIIHINSDGDWRWNTPTSAFAAETHGQDGEGQFKGFKKGYINLKLINPWKYAGVAPMSYFFMHPWLHEETRFEVAEGMGMSKFGTDLNINLFFKIPEEGERLIYIKEGEPLAYFVPYMDRVRKVQLEYMPFGISAGRNSFTNWSKFLVN